MTVLLALGWPLAVAAVIVMVTARRRARTGAERVTRACHELRGPLTNAMLALDSFAPAPLLVAGAPHHDRPTGPGSGPGSREFPRERPPTMPDLGLELDRARRAVEDLSAAFAGPRADDERRPVALAPLVDELVAVYDLTARARGRRVRTVAGDVDCVVDGDRARLAQAIGNLIQNAIEHGAGTVTVRVMSRDGRAQVRVADQGCGLPVSIDRLLAERPRGQRGRGIRIATEAVRAHGGALREAVVGGRASVVADLPLADVAGGGADRPAVRTDPVDTPTPLGRR